MSGIPAGAGQLLGKRLGKFDILALLALGGTAEIYLARIGGAAGFEKYVVVKCLHDHLADDAEFVKMFLDEARLAAHLDHSNIVQTMELGEHEGRYYMVMEFLAGLSLAMVVRRAAERLPSNRIPIPLVLNILAQSCAGLHYAHEKAMNGKALNIVHRDISPQNLVVSFEGVVKLVDFGIAKAELRETRTRSGTIKGKFAYMSPEQCVANNVDRRTDVFALGVIGHELLTGRRLFKKPSPYETYQAVMECDVKPPSTFDPQIDPALDQVIMGAITKDKAVRYPTAEAFGDALLSYLHHRGIGSGPGDVSRFFDAHFGLEIEEHSARMRELIAGREVVSVETGVTWGGGDAEDDRRDAGDLDHGRPADGSDEFGESQRASTGDLSLMFDDLGDGSRGESDDEMPAERTRIEANPLERVSELDRMSGRAPSVPPDGATRVVPPGAVPVPSASSSGMPPSGRFPDLANMPTMIAEEAAMTPPPSHAPSSSAAAAPAAALPAAALPAQARAQIAPMSAAVSGTPASGAAAGASSYPPGGPGPAAPSYPAGGPNGAPPSGMPPLSGMPPQAGPPRFASASASPMQPPPRQAPHGQPPQGQSPQGQSPQAPHGYPVLNAQLSAQIATGATVFPSEPHRGGAPPPGMPLPMQPGGPPMQPGGLPMQQPGGPSGRPGPRGSEPILPDGYSQPPSYPPDGAMFDAQRAAGLMSPVGQQYPENVDWDAAAAGRARAVPPWLLAVLFLGAIGIALGLTIIIAHIVR